MREPKKVTAGNSYSWTRSLGKYKAGDGWTLKYSIVNQHKAHTITATADGDDHDATISKTDSANYAAGCYQLIGFVEKGEERITVYSAPLIVTPDITKAHDFRSFAEKTLEAVEAVLAKTATKDQQSFMVDGQTLTRRSLPELIALRDRMRREVHAERQAAKVAAGVHGVGRVQVRFR